MKTSSEKEKKLSLALSKLKNLNHENPSLTNALQNLDDQKNQLEIEKKEIEKKYENLMQDYKQLKQKLDKINKHKNYCINKDLNGGAGTADDYDGSWGARLVRFARKNITTLPVSLFGNLQAIFKQLDNNVFFIETHDLSKITEKFDLIILSHVLEHILDINKFLSLIKSKLSAYGHVFIEVKRVALLFFHIGYAFNKIRAEIGSFLSFKGGDKRSDRFGCLPFKGGCKRGCGCGCVLV